MKRIFGSYAYSDAPRRNCWWDESAIPVDRPSLSEDHRCDVAIIGAGYTGLSAAYHLQKSGVAATVVDARYVGWGASGRNGGFCCLGGGKLTDAGLDAKFGKKDRIDFRRTEKAAVDLVDELLTELSLDVDRHSDGETELAHRPSDFSAFPDHVRRVRENYDVEAELLDPADLERAGMSGAFYGGLTIRAGFALNPRKYIDGLAAAAEKIGAKVYHETPVLKLKQRSDSFELSTPAGRIEASRIVVATNGYTSEDLPGWLGGRYLPTQSNVLVTRPLADGELTAQGWRSGRMAYDSRNLLHYFRLMPDNRFLFGLRGGLLSNPGAERRAQRRARRDFEKLFPAWRHVETSHSWSGMVCIARNQLPFVGEIPDMKGAFAGLCYHGNGVAMGTYAGALLADLVQDKQPERLYPRPLQTPLKRFELGRFRRLLMPATYAFFGASDLG